MPKQPLVSIIIPTYNRAHLISETLDSVSAQTYTNWECIVIDDGSTDGTETLLSQYITKDNRFQYYKRTNTYLAGGNGARNYGFDISQGEFIQWFDSDDLMLPHKLEVKVKTVLEHDVDFVVCEHAEIYSIDPYKTRKKWKISNDGDVLLNHLKGNIAFTTAGPFFKRSFLEGKVLFNETVLISQEWEFFSRLLTTKPKLFYLNIILYHFRNISSGIRNNKTDAKILNRLKTELSLFKYINKSKYFKGSIYLKAYDQYKFFWVLNKYKFLRNNFPNSVALPYFMTGLNTISRSYYFNSLFKAITKPKTVKVLLKGWKRN